MRVFWNEGTGQAIAGLDIVGVRRADQLLEERAVAGITTTTMRARYLSLLTWVLGVYHARTRHAGDRIHDLAHWREANQRLAVLMVLSAFQREAEGATVYNGQIIGNATFKPLWERLVAEDRVSLPARPGDTDPWGTYSGLMTLIGLITDDEPPRLTTAGTRIYKAREASLAEGEVLHELLFGDGVLERATLSRIAADVCPSALAEAPGECGPLRELLLRPPASAPAEARDNARRRRETLRFLALPLEARGPLTGRQLFLESLARTLESDAPAPGALRLARTAVARGYAQCTEAWLQALHQTLDSALGGRGRIGEVIEHWARSGITTERLKSRFGGAVPELHQTLAEWGERLDESGCHEQLLDGGAGRLPPASLAACMLAQALFLDRITGQIDWSGHPGFPAYATRLRTELESARHQSAAEALQRILARLVVPAHLANAYRKMQMGMASSLRLIREGESLMVTGQGVGAGYSLVSAASPLPLGVRARA